MGWTTERAPGHEGYVIGLVKLGADEHVGGYRELTRYVDGPRCVGGDVPVDMVQVACECGWRSPRLFPPITARWWPSIVDMEEDYEDAAARIWEEHAVAAGEYGDGGGKCAGRLLAGAASHASGCCCRRCK